MLLAIISEKFACSISDALAHFTFTYLMLGVQFFTNLSADDQGH